MRPRKRVIIESPFAAAKDEQGNILRSEDYHRRYALACLKDSLKRGEAPLASHLLYTQVLNDEDPDERMVGIEAGLSWLPVANTTVVYQDFGISSGMQLGIDRAVSQGVVVVFRKLGKPWSSEEKES